MTDKLRYKKINEFLENLNTREKRYILKRAQQALMQEDALKVEFTVNGAKI